MSAGDAAMDAPMDEGRCPWGGWSAEVRDDPFTTFARFRSAAPVHAVTLADGHAAAVVLGHGAAKQALSDRRLSKDMQAALSDDPDVVAEGLPGPAFSRHMLNVDPPDHTRLRRLVSAAFSASRVAALEPGIQALADVLLDELAADPGDTVDLVAGFAHPLPFLVITELLGIPENDRDDLRSWFQTLLSPWAGDPPPEAVAASDGVVGYLERFVDAKQRRPGDDLVSDLVQATVDGDRLDRQELLSTLFQLFVAGHDTTSSLIGNSVVALLDHPAQLAALRSDPTLLPGAVDELVRFTAPVPHATFRYATEPVDLDGVEVPSGRQVLVCLGAANRDPGLVAEPDTLDVRRSARSHLGFGHGIHFCLGANLARLEARIALGTLLSRFPELCLGTSRGALRWSHGDGLVLRGLNRLPVVLGRDGGAPAAGGPERGAAIRSVRPSDTSDTSDRDDEETRTQP